MGNRVFVYGSLKRGFYGHYKMARTTFIGETRTAKPLYRMVAFPWPDHPGEFYPGLLQDGDGYISGEIFEVSDLILKDLDIFEAVGLDYKREMILLADGSMAWAYISLNPKQKGLLQKHDRLGYEDGVYTWL